MRSAVLIRTGSSPLHSSSSSLIQASSPRVSMSYHDSVTGILFPGGKNNMSYSPRSNSLHLEIKENMMMMRKKMNNISSSRRIRRAYSENDISSEFSGFGSRSFSSRIPEENEEIYDDINDHHQVFKNENIDNCVTNSVLSKYNEVEDVGLEVYSGGGTGPRVKVGGGNGGGDGISDQDKICDYYQEMLKASPNNSLMLRNYGKFLFEVVKDVVKTEEYYSRAILADPSDGEALSMYGKLVWETRRDKSRAKFYFEQSIRAAPEDCFVMASYAHFLWDAEVEEEEEEEEEVVVAKITMTASSQSSSSTSTLIQAF